MITPGAWPHLSRTIERIHTSSALNPLLWLCGLTTLAAWALAAWTGGWLQVAFFCAGTVPIICALIAYFCLLFKDPDRLQSERFQLTRQQYELIGDDRHRGATIDAASEVISNPAIEGKTANGI
jgi:hypothetical protein